MQHTSIDSESNIFLKKIKTLLGNTNTSIQFNNAWYYFIDFMLKGKSLLEYTKLFSLNDYEINDKIILKYFQQILKRLNWTKSIVLFLGNIENFKTLKEHKFLKKHFFLLFAVSVTVKMKNHLNRKNQLRY